jgi:hypothetical protein
MNFFLNLAFSLLFLAAMADNDARRVNPDGCGRSTEKTGRSRRLINGTVSNQRSWRWQVILEDAAGSLCSGSLINSQWVVTSALVVDKSGTVSQATLGAPLGTLTRKVAKIVMHPDFVVRSGMRNIALIKLNVTCLSNMHQFR